MSGSTKSSKSANRSRYLKQRAQSQALITGPGIFFTCTRGKEIPASSELLNLLQSIADEFDLDSDHLDENEEEEEEDIESMIKKELEDIKASKPTHSLLKRFVYKKTDCECLGFIRFPKGRNPIQFINHLVKKVHEGQPGSGLRYIQRVTPVTATCPSTSLTAFKSLVTQVLKPYFGLDRTTSSTSFGLQYRIEPIIRCHDQPLNRTEVIKSIGEIVEDFNSEKYIGIKPLEDQVDSRIPLKHKVNLNNAKVVILVSVYKYVVGISVVSDYDQECKRFNLQAIAEAREKTQLDTSAKLKPIEVMPTDSSISICS